MARLAPQDVHPEPPLARHDVETATAALRDPTRRRILLDLIRDREPRTVDEVAAAASVHRTVAFTHLERLVAAGLVEKSQRRGRRGKPAALYLARSGAVEISFPARQFGLLASLLGAGLNTLRGEGMRTAKGAGREFGERIGRRDARGVSEALAPLRELGAEYREEPGRVVAANCVFLEACEGARRSVCGVQAGMIEGALRAAGMKARVTPEGRCDGGCSYSVSVA